jgi:hypothetical protein
MSQDRSSVIVDEDGNAYGNCPNPSCVEKIIREEAFHPSGLCGACCMRLEIGCPLCWPDDD